MPDDDSTDWTTRERAPGTPPRVIVVGAGVETSPPAATRR